MNTGTYAPGVVTFPSGSQTRITVYPSESFILEMFSSKTKFGSAIYLSSCLREIPADPVSLVTISADCYSTALCLIFGPGW